MTRQTTKASGQSITVRYVSGLERYIEQYRATTAAGGTEGIAPSGRRRMLLLTAAFTPMIAVAALPLTAGSSVVASIVANVTARWVGVVVLVTAVVGLGYLTARWAARYDDVPATLGWRRWLPLAATVVVVGSCLTEIVSGSRAPDPVIVLWFASIVWVAAFLPLAAGVWGPGRRALWTGGDGRGHLVRVDAGLLLVAIFACGPRPRRPRATGRQWRRCR